MAALDDKSEMPLEPLHHSDSFMNALQSPEDLDRTNPFGDLEAAASITSRPRDARRFRRSKLEMKVLKRSNVRLCLTVVGTMVAMTLVFVFISLLSRERVVVVD